MLFLAEEDRILNCILKGTMAQKAHIVTERCKSGHVHQFFFFLLHKCGPQGKKTRTKLQYDLFKIITSGITQMSK